MSNTELIQTFYQAFSNGDAVGMNACYADNIIFEDPAFGQLRGDAAKAMWSMLHERSQGNLKITFDNIKADEKTGQANWKAVYPYGPKKRQVINNVTAAFEFEAGKIVKHTDTFSLWKWSSQALGLPGHLLGWSSFMKGKIQGQTNKLLQKYQEQNS
jgi:ketosteroid isomerase-like protein